jgi:hypothetical protein
MSRICHYHWVLTIWGWGATLILKHNNVTRVVQMRIVHRAWVHYLPVLSKNLILLYIVLFDNLRLVSVSWWRSILTSSRILFLQIDLIIILCSTAFGRRTWSLELFRWVFANDHIFRPSIGIPSFIIFILLIISHIIDSSLKSTLSWNSIWIVVLCGLRHHYLIIISVVELLLWQIHIGDVLLNQTIRFS